MKLASAIKRCLKRSNGENNGWATKKDIRSLLTVPESGGVVIGGFDGKPIIYGGDNHVVAMACYRPVGIHGGKIHGLLIPALISYKGSVVVHDVGGMLYEATANHRIKLGQKVIRLAPSDDLSDFDLSELQNGDTPVTLYLIADGTRQVSLMHQELLASIIKNGLSATIRYRDGHIVQHYRHKLLLLLDNYDRFDGGVPGLDDAIPFMAGYGIQTFVIVQNSAQMQSIGKIVANSHIRVFVSPDYGDLETAEYISKMLGDVIDANGNRKPLLQPDEVLRIGPGPTYRRPDGSTFVFYGFACLTLRQGNAPIYGTLVPLLMLKSMAGRDMPS